MKLTEAELGWLAGIMDGEGTICLSKEKASRRNHLYARCTIHVIANTNPALIARVTALLSKVEIRYSIGTLIGEQKRAKNWKPAWNVKISTIDAMKDFLEMVRPYLVGKAEQADIAVLFLARRFSSHAAWGILESEELLIARCQELNAGKSESVETARRPSPNAMMIQSELGSDVESSAETTEPKPLN